MKIYGDYHTHSDNSDGKGTVEQIIDAAKSAGLHEVAITDHGHGRIISGVKPKQYSMVKALAEKCGEEKGIKALFRIEANITGTAGQIDFCCEEEYNNIDILLCGIHRFVKPANIISFFTFFVPNWFCGLIRWFPKSLIRSNTEIVKRALAQNNVDVYVHPNRYFKVNVVEVAKVCAERGILVELNSKKISFRPIDFERMLAVGAKFIVGSDAHSPRRVGTTSKVIEFLKLADYDEKSIINIGGTFKRRDLSKSGIKIETIQTQEEHNDVHSKREKRNLRKKNRK